MKTAILYLSLAAIVFIGGSPVKAQMPDTVKLYIDSALYIMEEKSLYGKNLDWKSVKDSVYLKVGEATSIQETFPALTYAFRKLSDHHGMIANQDTFYRLPYPEGLTERLSKGLKDEFLKGNRIVKTFLADSIGYIRVPGMPVVSQEEIEKLANRLRDTLCVTLAQSPKGLIIDLRMNAGGNSVPMQTGLGPLFKGPTIGYYVDRNDFFAEEIRLENGVSLDGEGRQVVHISQNCHPNPKMSIAVLIGPATGSSGEILAAFLKTQPNIRLFGEPTAGFCNATEGFFFMEKKGYMLLTVARMADSNGKIIEDMTVYPDENIKSEDNYDDLSEDATVKAALKWLNYQNNGFHINM